MSAVGNGSVYVLSGQVGHVGGAAKATLLLCEALADIGKRIKLFVTLPPAPAVAEGLASRGVEVVVPLVNKGWRWDLPQRLNALQIFLSARRHPPSFIHSVSLSAEAKYLLRFPRVAPLYLWESTEALPHVKFLDRDIHRLLHKAEAVLSPSETVAENIRQTYDYRGDIRLLPFWVESPPPSAPAPHVRTGNLLYVGRLDRDKGFEYLFDAFRQIQPSNPGVSLTVCGGGEIEMVRGLANGSPAIRVRGYVDADEYERVMNHCDAFVLPSLHEGYPLSLLEACARRKPVIATAVGSIPELFAGRPCALLAPPRDAASLAQSMNTLFAESEELYAARCADARALFEEVSSKPVVMARLADLYGAG